MAMTHRCGQRSLMLSLQRRTALARITRRGVNAAVPSPTHGQALNRVGHVPSPHQLFTPPRPPLPRDHVGQPPQRWRRHEQLWAPQPHHQQSVGVVPSSVLGAAGLPPPNGISIPPSRSCTAPGGGRRSRTTAGRRRRRSRRPISGPHEPGMVGVLLPAAVVGVGAPRWRHRVAELEEHSGTQSEVGCTGLHPGYRPREDQARWPLPGDATFVTTSASVAT
jgi:hypothetical protein